MLICKLNSTHAYTCTYYIVLVTLVTHRTKSTRNNVLLYWFKPLFNPLKPLKLRTTKYLTADSKPSKESTCYAFSSNLHF